MVHTTLRRASRAFGTVYNRISTCGKPAVPSTSASASEMKLSLVVVLTPYSSAGPSTRVPAGLDAAACCSRLGRLNPALDSTHRVVPPRGREDRGLDDLHPGRALHPADEHVEDHEDADDSNNEVLADKSPSRRAGGSTRAQAQAIWASR